MGSTHLSTIITTCHGAVSDGGGHRASSELIVTPALATILKTNIFVVERGAGVDTCGDSPDSSGIDALRQSATGGGLRVAANADIAVDARVDERPARVSWKCSVCGEQ